MNTRELIDKIQRAKFDIEMALEENGGELTADVMAQYDTLEDMKAILAGEGIDDLGRWLKAVQDEGAALKAEADAAARRVKNNKRYEEYVKDVIGRAMDVLELPTNAAGDKVAKGQFYGFKRCTSTKSAVNSEALDNAYLPLINTGLCHVLPSWLHVELKTTTTELRQAGGDALAFLDENTAPALTFTKPRAAKE